MTPESPNHNETSLAKEAMNRADTLTDLKGNPMTRVELVAPLDVSRPTVHRTVQALGARDLLVEQSGNVKLSVYDEAVADEVASYRQGINAASHIQPFLNTIPELPADFDVGLFDDASLSETSQSDPYAPIM
jgi:predicted transcriptional regulator